MTTKERNRIRVVLAEINLKNKWLADKLGKNQITVSQWCNNICQSSIATLAEIANVLAVDISQRLNPTKEK